MTGKEKGAEVQSLSLYRVFHYYFRASIDANLQSHARILRNVTAT